MLSLTFDVSLLSVGDDRLSEGGRTESGLENRSPCKCISSRLCVVSNGLATAGAPCLVKGIIGKEVEWDHKDVAIRDGRSLKT